MAIFSSLVLKKLLLKGAEAFAKESGKQLSKAIFGALFGKSEGLTKEQFEQILRAELKKTAREIKDHIDEKFREQKENEAILALRELETLLGQYIASNRTSVDLLPGCTQLAVEAVVAFDDIGKSAIQHFALSVSLMIIVYEERAAVISSDQRLVIEQRIVPMAKSVLEQMVSQIESNIVRNRVQLVGNPLFSDKDGETIIATRYWVTFDGNRSEVETVGGNNPAPAEMAKTAAKYRGQVRKEVREELDWVESLTTSWTEKYGNIAREESIDLVPADFLMVVDN